MASLAEYGVDRTANASLSRVGAGVRPLLRRHRRLTPSEFEG